MRSFAHLSMFFVGYLLPSYLASFVGHTMLTVTNSIEKIVYLSIFHIFLVLFLWSYFQTIFSPIGRPRKEYYLTNEVRRTLANVVEEAESSSIIERYARQREIHVETRNYDGSIRFCYKCMCIKPDRCHHCSVCGHCVLKFDHHCPWVNTCVNYYNYKFFVLFLGYGFALCAWGMLTDFRYFLEFLKNGMLIESDFGKFHLLLLFVVSGMFAISLACLLSYHLYLTSKNRSTIETFRAPILVSGPNKSAYNVGIRRNFKQVFGSRAVLWFFPLYSSRGDGIEYPLNIRVEGLQRCSNNYDYSVRRVMKFYIPLIFCVRVLRYRFDIRSVFRFTIIERLGDGLNFPQFVCRYERKKLLAEDLSESEDEELQMV